MACRCDGYEDMTIRENREEIDRLTNWLCYLMGEIDIFPSKEYIFKLPPDLSQWWQKHKEADKIREAKERQLKKDHKKKKEALAKLTKEEKKLLGLEA